jgi:hypothetical protein
VGKSANHSRNEVEMAVLSVSLRVDLLLTQIISFLTLVGQFPPSVVLLLTINCPLPKHPHFSPKDGDSVFF